MKIKSFVSCLTIVFVFHFHSSQAQTPPCDPALHEKPGNPLRRSPTECETEFDMKVRRAIAIAFDSVNSKNDWIVEYETPLKEITEVDHGTEKYLYDIGKTDVGGYNLKMVLSPESQEYREWSEKTYDFLNNPEKMQGENYPKFQDFMYRMKSATRLTVYLSMNTASQRFSSFKGGYQILNHNGAAYIFRAPYVAAGSGGDIENSGDATFICIGRWNTPSVVKHDDGSESIEIQGKFNAGDPKLSVQNIWIRIEGNSLLTDEVISKLNFQVLQNLISN